MSTARAIRDRSVVTINAFGKRLSDYTRWRDGLIDVIDEYQSWVEQQGLTNGEEDLRIYELLDRLRSDKLTIALVAEFSRGKTELINATFFSDYRQRILPSSAGRTTMCPTELLYEEQEEPCLKLLPIETRKSSLTIAEYKRTPAQWTVRSLDITSPRKMADALQEVARTKHIPLSRARELGLWRESKRGVGPVVDRSGQIEISMWRHAIINFPHPLLKQGLVVLDTPGLNALGLEPELSLNTLTNCEAVLFILGADTGVTQSDLDVWNNHVCIAKTGKSHGRIAVLNKIDILWDELRNETAFASMLSRQTSETARALGVGRNNIIPVSAQKGLLAKIKTDHALLKKSGLPALEAKLSAEVIGAKQQLVRERVKREIGDIVESTAAMIEARLSAVGVQLGELRNLGGKSQDAIQHMINHMRTERQAYDKTLTSFQATRLVLSGQIKILLDYLSMDSFDELTAKTRRDMNESWSTRGLRIGMQHMFKGVLDAMEKANRQAQHTRNLVQAVYDKLHLEHGLAKIKPTSFSLLTFRSQLRRLHEEAETFRNSPVMFMTEQRFVVKKFFVTLVGRARTILADCNGSAQTWSKAIMAPILAQVREYKILMDQRLENLKKVHENLDNLGGRIAEVEAAKQNLENQLTVIRSMLHKIHQPLPLDN